jgi:hypothetical protein
MKRRERSTTREVTVSTRIRRSERQSLEQLASVDDRTVSALLRRWIRAALRGGAITA